MKVAIAGAGLSGATVAQQLRADGHDVTVFDRRPHLAGNAYDYKHFCGPWIHQYGPHIFHTKIEKVYRYLSRFTEFVPYDHRVTAITERGYVPFPPNIRTMQLYKKDELLETFYRPYTELMWDRALEEVSPQILNRVPVRDDGEDRYFPNDPFQGMPKDGYTAMVERMLDGCEVKLNTHFVPADFGNYDKVFYCGSPDEIYGHNALPYRTIDFFTEVKVLPKDTRRMFPTATMNFAGALIRSLGYTRVTEWSHFPNSDTQRWPDRTVITFERPRQCASPMERYYPVRTDNSILVYDGYVKMIEKDYPNVTLLGRCGNFVYIDIDQAVNMGLAAANKMLKKES